MSSTRALIMFARPPVAGNVKTRLGPVFTPEEALSLYEAMLIDGIERMRHAAADLATPSVLWSADCAPSAALEQALQGIRVGYQMGDDLGERMMTALQDNLRSGFRQVVIIGSDSPHLPVDYLHQAFEALLAVDVVIGPAEDRGYYLIGCRRLHPRLFRNVAWGTDEVLPLTRRRIRQGRITCHELPPWYDIDTPADALRLWNELRHMKARGAPDVPARTFQALARLVPGRL